MTRLDRRREQVENERSFRKERVVTDGAVLVSHDACPEMERVGDNSICFVCR